MIPMGSTVFTWKHLAVDSLTKTSNLLKVWKEEWPHNGKKNTIRLLTQWIKLVAGKWENLVDHSIIIYLMLCFLLSGHLSHSLLDIHEQNILQSEDV